MSEQKLDAYCGLYCGACDIKRLYDSAREKGTSAQWSDMPEEFRRFRKETPLVCHGCKSDTLFAGCRACPILRCARRKGVESCGLCPKYPCFTFTLMKLVIRLRKLDTKLPHIKVRLPNLAAIKEKGLPAFLQDQEQAWTCPGCGYRFSWYQKTCPSCSRELDSLKPWLQAKSR